MIEMNTVTFTVPLTPPSINRYVRHTRGGRHYVQDAAVKFKEAVAIFAKGQRLLGKSYSVTATVFYGKGERGDLDNRAKLILDGLQDARIIHSDAAVTEIHLYRDRDRLQPRTEITVRIKP